MDIILTRTGNPLPDANSAGTGALAIFGPVGIATFVERQMHALEADIGLRIAHHDELTEPAKVDVTELEPGDTFTIADVNITTAAAVVIGDDLTTLTM
jgi:ribonuclease Z